MTDPAPKVTSIRPEIDADLVKALEEWTERARNGELIGAVLLGNERGDKFGNRWAGRMPGSVALIAFEHWKLRLFDL
jgi:hypothetical protein